MNFVSENVHLIWLFLGGLKYDKSMRNIQKNDAKIDMSIHLRLKRLIYLAAVHMIYK